ncbi:MAG TPA: copper chaperone PCu(A)C, partial [Acidocella sp.]|nr:copper chaperone PCu(A)C [Acidocella sp.]
GSFPHERVWRIPTETSKGDEMRGKWLAAWLVLVPAQALAGSAEDIQVQNPWIRYLLPSVPAGGYMVLLNKSDTQATLTAASSPACSSLMLHQSMNMGGTAMMMAVASVPIPAHGQAELVEGGYHLMCTDPKMKAGDHVPLTLTFGDGSSRIMSVPVYGATGAP